jgi:hypothetical protein
MLYSPSLSWIYAAKAVDLSGSFADGMEQMKRRMDPRSLNRPYTNEFGYCNDPFCDIEEGHKHGPLCRMLCNCKI